MPSKDDRQPDFILMGESRHGPQVKDITGSRGIPKAKRDDLEEALRTGSARAVAAGAVAAVAASVPILGVLYTAYQVARYVYPIVAAGVKTKFETGDSEQAREAMKEKVVEQVGRVVVDVTVDAISNAAVDGAAKSAGMQVTEPAKKIVSAAISEAITEVIE
jgi:hypothetical protein